MSGGEIAIRFPAEWEAQDGVQLTWPHAQSDWAPLLDEVVPNFMAIAREILAREICVVVCRDSALTRHQLGSLAQHPNLRLVEINSNDTWARDHAPLSVFENGEPHLLDFTFNGWGMKFAANLDNLITRKLFEQGLFAERVVYRNMLNLVLEGGSVESDGTGTLLTTEACLRSPNRNEYLSQEALERCLRQACGVERILWLKHGGLVGDDTDSHIDTLARFCAPDTIAYVRCQDQSDEHYQELALMEAELQELRTVANRPYNLVPLPLPRALYDGHERLPATYANFLFLNGALLLPLYGVPEDGAALEILRGLYPQREVVGVDCRQLIRQHGSLHCVTMQYPSGFLR